MNDTVKIIVCLIVLYTIYEMERRDGLRVSLKKATLSLSNSLDGFRKR